MDDQGGVPQRLVAAGNLIDSSFSAAGSRLPRRKKLTDFGDS
jgi:hypothetical protein